MLTDVGRGGGGQAGCGGGAPPCCVLPLCDVALRARALAHTGSERSVAPVSSPSPVSLTFLMFRLRTMQIHGAGGGDEQALLPQGEVFAWATIVWQMIAHEWPFNDCDVAVFY